MVEGKTQGGDVIVSRRWNLDTEDHYERFTPHLLKELYGDTNALAFQNLFHCIVANKKEGSPLTLFRCSVTHRKDIHHSEMKLHDLNEGALEGRAIACIGKPAINAIKKDLHPHFKLFYDSANALMNDVKKQIKAFKDTQRDDLKDAYVTKN